MNAFFRGQKTVFKCNYKNILWNLKRYTQVHNRINRTYKSNVELSQFLVNNNVKKLGYSTIAVNSKDGHLNNHFQIRNFHRNSIYDLPSSSKLEECVNTIKTKKKEKEEEQLKQDIKQILSPSPHSPKVPEKIVKKPLKTRIWEECLHYYHGFRLLFIDINISRKLIGRLLVGKTLTRRENRLLLQTVSDLFRLVPFSIFIIVPFLELTLPFFIKFFPGMLPSTFQTSKDREDKLKQNLAVKLEMAKFLQKTLDTMALQHKQDNRSEDAKQFAEFFTKIKNQNEYVSPDEIIKFSKRFQDEITLDSLSREQLLALCRILEIPTIGTNSFITFQLRLKMRKLAADDRIIAKEGVESLNLNELQMACKARGMRAYGLSEERLRSQLQDWIQLNLNEKVPSSLLLLSRALMMNENLPTSDKLKDTIRKLPEQLLIQTKACIGELEGKIDNKTKIEIIKEEERKCKEEREEESQEIVEKERQKAETLVDQAPITNASTVTEIRQQEQKRQKDRELAQKTKEESSSITSEDAELLSEALVQVSKEKQQLLVEKETIKELKEEIEDYKEDIEELKEITTIENKEQVSESRAAKLLFKKVNKMIGSLENELSNIEKTVSKNNLEKEPPKPIVDADVEPTVQIDELLKALTMLKKVTDATKIQAIEAVLSKIDADNDGQIKVDDLMKIVEAIGKDNVKLNEIQIGELVDLLEKEEVLEAESKIEKALAKSIKDINKKSEELIDNAPVLEDKATILDKEQNTLNFNKQEENDTKQKTETQVSRITPIPPLPSTPKNTNPKDKML